MWTKEVFSSSWFFLSNYPIFENFIHTHRLFISRIREDRGYTSFSALCYWRVLIHGYREKSDSATCYFRFNLTLFLLVLKTEEFQHSSSFLISTFPLTLPVNLLISGSTLKNVKLGRSITCLLIKQTFVEHYLCARYHAIYVLSSWGRKVFVM